MLKKIVAIAHDILKEHLHENSIAVDFTCGSGNDTKFLAAYVKKVVSYDIQEEALMEAYEVCKDYQNIEFHHKSHLLFDEDVQSFDVGIFNLGYYPKGDHLITTKSRVVVETLHKALGLLNEDGIILFVCYPGFESGQEEAMKLEEFCSTLSSKQFDCYFFRLLNRKNAPYIIGIEKH